MNVLDLLTELRNKDIYLRVYHDKLRVDAPDGTLTSDLLEALNQRKSEIIAFLNESKRFHLLLRVVPVSRDKNLPLSFSQERLWFLHQLDPESSAYNMPGSIRLKGRLDREALKQTFTELTCRHETLRTTFRFVDGQPEQVIAAEPFPSLEKVDLRQWPFHERVVEALRLADEQSRKPFDLVAGPLFRTTLYQLDDEDHLLHVNLHHIISDYWSFGVMNREFTELYRAFATGTPPQLPDLPIQYADFAYSQRQWLQGEVLATHLAYWREKLGGELTTLDLPTDRPRPAVQTHHGAEQSLVLSQPLIEALRELSRREGASLFMVLLAVFKMLLFRYTGQEDIVVGTPIAGRNRMELEGLIGFFINTIVMRTDLSGDPSFKELLERVRETALGAYAHQEMPFEKLVEELSPKRDLSRTPLFQVFFNYIRVNESRTELPGLEAEAAGGIEREAKFDMTFYVWEQSEAVRLTINYNASLFSHEMIICFLEQFQNLLDQIVVDTGVTIQAYSLLTPESRRILPDPGIPLATPPQTLVTDMFASWVRRTPEKTAVTKGNRVLTYRELSERALKLAEILQGCGVNRGDVVALHGSRSFGLIVGMMAVFLSGGVLLPIDENLPRQGQKTVVLEGGAEFLLWVRDEVRDEGGLGYDPGLNIRVIAVDAAGLAEAPTEPVWEAVLLPEVSSDDAAYLFFTSGTTGVPKGILGSHRGLSHFLSWQRETFGITPEDRVAQFTSLSFDPVLREIFLPLTSGATLCLPEDIDILASDDVLSWLDRERISILHTVPTLAQSWLTTATIGFPLAAIRCVFFAGEPLTGSLVQRWRSAFPGSRVINLYGPTETTLAKCFYEVSGDAPPGIVPLGMPLPQTQALVLSRENQLCGIGELGEIVLRTPFRTLGYVNNEEENRKRFVKNPFRDDETDLVYFTGDRGRYRPDGMLEFLGRLDDQVKIRGVRVEPNEIAVALVKHPAVESCFVTGLVGEQGRTYLAAYVVAARPQSATESELRTFLKERLPAGIVPEAFVFLDALPLTPRGKIDRQALPSPDPSRPELGEDFIAPRSQSEELVAGIWSDVLGRKRIGVYDEFFDLGGHSLLVMQIISRIRRAFGVELPVRSLFEAPTVAGLTERIEMCRISKQGLQLPPIQAITRDQELPLSFAQERLWFLHQMEPDSVAYSMPYAVRFKGILRKEVLKQTFTEMARRHETLRTTIVSFNGMPGLTIAKDPNIHFETVDLRHVAYSEREGEARRLIDEDAGKPFDLPHGPLLRVFVFQLGDREHVMYFNMDHIVSDFWSLGIITREFAALYTSFLKGETSLLPELPIQYVDFAHWQRKWLQGDVLKEQIRYWKEKLGGQISVLDLPTDNLRPPVQNYRGARQSLTLPKHLTEAIKTMSRRAGATLFMTLLAAFKALLFRLTGQEDILVGTPISGRNRVELEGLIGIFMNTIVMRTDLSGDPTFKELLERVRETALGAYSHQEMPFERLVEDLAPNRDLSRTPLFQVFFNHIVADDYQIELPGLEVGVFGQMERESKFDMTLYVGDSRGEITLTALYNADLFDAARIATMLNQYQELLKQAVENSEEKITRYSLLTPEEENKVPDPTLAVKREWAGAVHERFSEQAGHAPEQTAVVDAWGSWSYGELDRYSNQLAGHLRFTGIETGDIVAVHGYRSAGLVLALLGVLKAGAAFLILDSRYPASRLVKMLEDASPHGWLQMEAAGPVVDELNEWVDTFQTACRLTIPGTKKEVEDLLQGMSQEFPKDRVVPDDKAYITFTSGTTGQPKGIVGTHRPLAHFLEWHCREFGLKRSDRFSMLSGLSHDPLLRDIFTPLWLGATLCIPDADEMLVPAKLRSWMKTQQITVTHMTPALGQLLFDDAGKANTGREELSGLRYVFFGGDTLTRRHVEKIREIAPEATCVNYYGTTETPQAMGYQVVEALDGDQLGELIPLGKGIEGVQLLVLNPVRQLAGIGELGEIYVRTPYLTRGYLNDEALTYDRFIPNPFTNVSEDRLYRTGDLGRYLPDGRVMFYGRGDSQVSIRGFRVELKEIEAILGKHPDIRGCAVVAGIRESGERYLVAYVVCGDHRAAETVYLRGYLIKHLPDYMIPSAFVQVDEIPMSPNGKIDLTALPDPGDAVGSERTKSYEPPKSPTEQLLVEIWSRVLGVQQIGINDNFFQLGGHSLLAAQMISRVREALEVDLPLRSLFENPNIADLAAYVHQMTGKSEALRLPRVVPIPRDRSLPLSFAQERLWFLNQLEPESTAYSMPGSIRLRGRLDQKTLEQALVELARRHETLRTTFRLVDGRPEQVIAPEPGGSLAYKDFRGIPEAIRESEVLRLADEQSREPFDLVSGPLFRTTLYQLDEEDHVMHVNLHHIISDYWSFGILNREFVELYQALATGSEPRLSELPVQYADFAYCQRQWLQGEVLADQLAYWKEKLGGELPTLDLPTDRPRPAVQTHRGAEQSLNLPKDLIVALRDIGRREGLTMFMTLLAAFKALLFRITGQEDIVLGTPISGRNRVELEGLIGFFMNTIVMRSDLSGDPTFKEVFDRVRETALSAYAHQEMPFEKLVEELAPRRDLSRTPLFQVFFNHIRVDEGRSELTGLKAEVVGGFEREAKFDLTLYVWEQADTIRLTALYNADLFDAERMATMLKQYEVLLRQVVANPEEKITRYSLLTPEEENKVPDPTLAVKREWAGAVHERFSEQAGHAPEQTAVVDAWGSWSYGELDRYSNQLAGHLRFTGIETGDIVAVHGYRSAGLVLALLGVLKAGAAFLILDSRYPASRLVKMLEDASPHGWLQMEAAGPVVDELNEWVDTFQTACRLTIPGTKKEVEDLLQGMSQEFPKDRVVPDDKAYITFTSGTTGQPKGIVGTHRPLAHFLEWHCREFGLKRSDRFSMLSGLSHDPLLRDIFTPLWLGATLCIPDADEMLVPAKLRSWMKTQQITVTHMTPALGQLLFDDAGKANTGREELSGLRYVFFGGDTLTRRHVEKIREIAPEATCVNYYGTTETPQAMGYQVVEALDGDQLGELIPLGKGIEGVQLLVLNPVRKLAGIGELGEIYVRTPYLTRGYLNDEALTYDRFIPNPFTNVSEDRLYKTGDLGRYLPDGRVMFYGRGDSQVSIRGFRVELKEIEAILGKHPDIRGCAVVAGIRESGDRYLTAYVVGNNTQVLDPIQLRQHVGRHLPDYMIPSAFVQAEELPLTPNGKIDLAKLIQMDPPPFDRCKVRHEPQTETEEMLLSIWKEVLSLDHISVHHNFFEIGGHSLLSIQVISRIEEKIGLRVNPREFIYQTLGQLAASIERQIAPAPIKRGGKKTGFWNAIKRKMVSGNHQK